jgi:translocation and assembly module TamB
VGTVAVVDGAAHLELAAGGTVGQPTLAGTLKSTGLRIDAAEYGLHFADGRLAATLADGTLRLDELSLAGGAGRFTASGTLARAAQAGRDPESAMTRITWQAERFRVLNRPDLRLVASGAGTLAIADRRLSIDGKLRADEGHFDYSPDTRVALGDDVVVKGWPPRTQGAARTERIPLTLDLELDFGDKLSFSGEGLEAGLRGKLAVTTAPDGSLRGRGSISTESGSYFAFGQRLAIDRGRLIFDGPLDNPGLDIVALRRNLAVEAGVAVSGTVRVPIIQLTSNPPVPDNEKLSWLVLGQGLDRTSGADVAALQAASAALFGRNARPITTTIAQSVGLDDITFRTASGRAGGAAASGQAVAFGKRLTDRLSLVYEQGLTVAANALRLEYSLSRTLTLRAEAGVISGFGIYYRRTFE